ncbi:uncharacterized protein VTP21DRAFT_3639 [Calcarisporiella thermophila]|uniref:uncharacterized protein n=1 Tax=Calcarisporiella thermophila TaxID=911321 RepID=UPI00374304C2
MDDTLTRSHLETLKRPQLQRLAKKYGVKANLKNAEIIEKLLQVDTSCFEGKDIDETNSNESESLEDTPKVPQCEFIEEPETTTEESCERGEAVSDPKDISISAESEESRRREGDNAESREQMIGEQDSEPEEAQSTPEELPVGEEVQPSTETAEDSTTAHLEETASELGSKAVDAGENGNLAEDGPADTNGEKPDEEKQPTTTVTRPEPVIQGSTVSKTSQKPSKTAGAGSKEKGVKSTTVKAPTKPATQPLPSSRPAVKPAPKSTTTTDKAKPKPPISTTAKLGKPLASSKREPGMKAAAKTGANAASKGTKPSAKTEADQTIQPSVDKEGEQKTNEPYVFGSKEDSTTHKFTFGSPFKMAECVHPGLPEKLQSILTEMEQRVTETKNLPTPERKQIMAKVFGNQGSTTPFTPRTLKLRFDGIHEKEFNKLDSIVTHYAAKRRCRPDEDEEDRDEDAGKHARLSAKTPFKKRKLGVEPPGEAGSKPSTSAGSQPYKPIYRNESSKENKTHTASRLASLKKKSTISRSPHKTKRQNIWDRLSKPAGNKSSEPPQHARHQSTKPATAAPPRPKFDLQASLKRQLGYVPYTGKVKPLAPMKPLHERNGAAEGKRPAKDGSANPGGKPGAATARMGGGIKSKP